MSTYCRAGGGFAVFYRMFSRKCTTLDGIRRAIGDLHAKYRFAVLFVSSCCNWSIHGCLGAFGFLGIFLRVCPDRAVAESNIPGRNAISALADNLDFGSSVFNWLFQPLDLHAACHGGYLCGYGHLVLYSDFRFHDKPEPVFLDGIRIYRLCGNQHLFVQVGSNAEAFWRRRLGLILPRIKSTSSSHFERINAKG